MSHPSPVIAVKRREVARRGMARAARWGAALALVASSLGCVLTQDIPDPALDVPGAYKYGGPRAEDAPPALDWWRGFNSTEMTTLMEEAQRVNLDIAAAVARMLQADALARQAGAALLPAFQGNGSQTYSRTSGSSASGLTNNGREITNYKASLSASYTLDFWGANRDALQAAEETATADRFDRDVTALTHADGGRDRLFQRAGLAGSAAHRAEQHRQRAAHPQRRARSPPGRHRHRSRRRAAGERARQPEGAGAAAEADARPERQRAGRAGVAADREHPHQRRLARFDRNPAGDGGSALGNPDPAARYPPPGGAARLRHRQYRQCPRAVLIRPSS